MADKHYISNAQLESLFRCGIAYSRRYNDGEIIPPGIAAMKGKGFHGGAQANFQQKRESHIDLPVSDIIDAAVATFEAESHGGYALTDEERQRGSAKVLGEAKDQLVDMAEFHAIQQAPDYQPVLVEQRVRIVLPNSPRDLLGIIDLADDQRRVTDFKTAGKSKSQAEVDASTQLTIYSIAHKAVTGEPASSVRLDTAVTTSAGIKRQVLESSRGDADVAALANRMSAALRIIDSGNFAPATPGAWWCSPKWCGYWSTCPYVNSERAARAIE